MISIFCMFWKFCMFCMFWMFWMFCAFCTFCMFCKFCMFCMFWKFCMFFTFCMFCTFCIFWTFCTVCTFCTASLLELLVAAKNVTESLSENITCREAIASKNCPKCFAACSFRLLVIFDLRLFYPCFQDIIGLCVLPNGVLQIICGMCIWVTCLNMTSVCCHIVFRLICSITLVAMAFLAPMFCHMDRQFTFSFCFKVTFLTRTCMACIKT